MSGESPDVRYCRPLTAMVDILAGLAVHILRLGRPQPHSDLHPPLSRISGVRSVRIQMVRTNANVASPGTY